MRGGSIAVGPRRSDAIEVRLPSLTLSVTAPGADDIEVRAVVMQSRELLDAFRISRRDPAAVPESAPRVVRIAADAAQRLQVPLAAAATGALVQAVGEDLAARYGEATVTANGVAFVATMRPREVALEGGGSVFTITVGPDAPAAAFASGARPDPLPGRADAVAVVADHCGIVEVAALAAAEMVSRPRDVPAALDRLRATPGVRSAVVAAGRAVAAFGGIRIDAA